MRTHAHLVVHGHILTYILSCTNYSIPVLYNRRNFVKFYHVVYFV